MYITLTTTNKRYITGEWSPHVIFSHSVRMPIDGIYTIHHVYHDYYIHQNGIRNLSSAQNYSSSIHRIGCPSPQLQITFVLLKNESIEIFDFGAMPRAIDVCFSDCKSGILQRYCGVTRNPPTNHHRAMLHDLPRGDAGRFVGGRAPVQAFQGGKLSC